MIGHDTARIGMHTTRVAARGVRRGFTIVELVVAIAVILVLFALTVTATVTILEKSEVRETENTIRLLDMAYQEWKLDADRELSWGVAGEPFADAVYDMLNSTPHVYTSSEVLRRVRKSPKSRSILAQIDPRFTVICEDVPEEDRPGWARLAANDDPDPNKDTVADAYPAFLGEMVVLDAWGNPIRVVHPGRLPDENFFGDDLSAIEIDEDGTLHIDDQSAGEDVPFYETEMRYGVALNRRLLFVSAGPDGKFGDLSADESGTPAEQRLHEQIHDNVYSYTIEDAHP